MSSSSPPPRSPPPSPTGRRLALPCWTHDETLALLDAYRDKWLALRRRNLRANDWQDVAGEVGRRSAATPGASPKTTVQCRHKIEKLRKRYRNERRKPSSWPYFQILASIDAASATAGAAGGRVLRRPLVAVTNGEVKDADNGEEEGEKNGRSLGSLMADGGLRFAVPKALRSKISRVEAIPGPNPRFNKSSSSGWIKLRMPRRIEERRKEGEGDVVAEMASVLRVFGDAYLRMEERKMEMVREVERARMEMEMKRTEMMMDSQRRIVDAFVQGFVGMNRVKASPED